MADTKGCKTARWSESHQSQSKFGSQSATRLREGGVASNRGSACRGEYVPGPCTHRPSHHERQQCPTDRAPIYWLARALARRYSVFRSRIFRPVSGGGFLPSSSCYSVFRAFKVLSLLACARESAASAL